MAGQILKLCTYFLISHVPTVSECVPPVTEPTVTEPTCHEAAAISQDVTEAKSQQVEQENSDQLAGIQPFCDQSQDTSVRLNSRLKELQSKARSTSADAVKSADTTAATYMPGTTVFFAQISDPPALLDQVLNHPVRAKIEALEPVQEFYKSPQFLMAQVGEKYIQWQLGDSWDNLVKRLTDRGMFLGFDAKTQGVVVLFRTSDEAKLKQVAGALLGFIETQAKNESKPAPFKKAKYRGHSTAKFDQAIIARVNDWFLFSNKEALAKQVADRIIDEKTDGSLAGLSTFSNAIKGVQPDVSLWAYADLDTLRKSGAAKELFEGRTNQPFVELLAGGVLESFKTAKFASAAVQLDNKGLSISFSTPFDKSSAADDRAYFFGQDKNGQAPKPLLPKNTIANVIAHRDIAQWWLSKESLFDESVIAGLAQADSQLSTMFAGLDFGEEVLGATQPGVQVVVTEQTFAQEYQPDVKLPSFALVFRLKETELDIKRRFKIAYQSLLGIVNYSLAQQGNPQLEMATEKTSKGEIISATYLLSDDDRKGLINYNFSPSIAFSGDYFMISSTRQLANELSKLAENADPAATVPTNTMLTIDADELDKILKLNRESLIAQTMIENGQDREAAAEEVDMLLMIPGFFDRAKVELQVNPESIDLSARIDIK